MAAPTDDDRRDGAPATPGDRPPLRRGGTGPSPGLSSAWTVLREGGRTAVVRRDFAPRFRSLGLLRAADVPPTELSARARPFRPGGGRGELALLPAGELGEVVVRPFRRGGLVSRVVAARYLLGDRAFRELGLTVRFRRKGVPAVEPLAAVQSSRRPGYRAALLTRFLPDAAPAPEVLGSGDGPGASDAADPGGESAGRAPRGDAAGRDPGGDLPPLRDALRRMGRSTRRLHAAGGHHADLNAHNFLLPTDRGRPAVLLDFDRARAFPGPLPRPLARWSLRRLRRSMAKLELDAALRAWDAFEEGYRAAPEGPTA